MQARQEDRVLLSLRRSRMDRNRLRVLTMSAARTKEAMTLLLSADEVRELPKAGERWFNRQSKQTVRVMAVAENWVMWRHKGCQPSVLHINDWRVKMARTLA